DWINPFFRSFGNQLHNGATFLRVIGGGDVVLRLVQEHVDHLFTFKAFTIITYFVFRWIHFAAAVGYSGSVYGNDAGCDQFVDFSSGTYARVRDVSVKTNHAIVTWFLLGDGSASFTLFF